MRKDDFMIKKITLTAFVISAVMLAACGNNNTSTNVTTAPTTAEITTTTSPPVTTTVATEITTTTTAPTTEVETTTCLTLDNSVTELIVTTVPTTAEITTTTSPPVTVTTTTTAQTTITTTEPIVTTAPTTAEQTTTAPPVTTQTTINYSNVDDNGEPYFNADGSINKNRWHYNVDAEIETLKLYNEYRAENGLPCNYVQNEAWASYADRLVYYMAENMQLQHSMSVMEVISRGAQDTGTEIINGFKNSPKHNDLLLGVCNGYHFDIDYVAVSSFYGEINYNVIILEDRTFEEYFNNLTKVLITEYWFENEFNISEETMINIRDNMSDDEKYAIFIEKGYDKYYPHLVR